MTDPAQPALSEDLTDDDQLVQPTGNGLRPDDETFLQPSQDPDEVPSTLVDAEGVPLYPPAEAQRAEDPHTAGGAA